MKPTEADRVRFATLADRSRYEDDMSQELEKAEEEVDELEQQRSIQVNVEKLAFLRKSVAELKDLLEGARHSLEKLEARDGEAWLRARLKVEADTAAFWSALQEAKTALGLS